MSSLQDKNIKNISMRINEIKNKSYKNNTDSSTMEQKNNNVPELETTDSDTTTDTRERSDSITLSVPLSPLKLRKSVDNSLNYLDNTTPNNSKILELHNKNNDYTRKSVFHSIIGMCVHKDIICFSNIFIGLSVLYLGFIVSRFPISDFILSINNVNSHMESVDNLALSFNEFNTLLQKYDDTIDENKIAFYVNYFNNSIQDLKYIVETINSLNSISAIRQQTEYPGYMSNTADDTPTYQYP